MADYVIFKIGAVDYTAKIKTQEYSALKNDVVETWVDGNYITHTDVVRTRITGSVHMVMRKAEYNQLLTDMENAKVSPGCYTLNVHVDNDTTETQTVQITASCTVSTSVVYGTPAYFYDPVAMDVNIEFEEL